MHPTGWSKHIVITAERLLIFIVKALITIPDNIEAFIHKKLKGLGVSRVKACSWTSRGILHAVSHSWKGWFHDMAPCPAYHDHRPQGYQCETLHVDQYEILTRCQACMWDDQLDMILFSLFIHLQTCFDRMTHLTPMKSFSCLPE